IDSRSDLFSLGSVLYEMCTGRLPFRAETPYGVLRRISEDKPRPIRELNAAIPGWLAQIIDGLHQKEPSKRFGSAAEVAALLEQCLAHVQQPIAVPLPAVLAAPHRPRGLGRTKVRVLLGTLAGVCLVAFALYVADVQRDGEPAPIAQLITQLGSDSFADREKATKELEKIGTPALDALRKATQGDDPERKRRAAQLVSKIEARVLEAAMLAARRVHLVYKDTPLAEAVADFKKQCGYDLTLSDPEGKVKERTITLDTGAVTFWQAFDQFCRKAGLVEAALPAARPAGLAPGQALTALRPAGASAGGGGIILTDGKPLTLPTDANTAIRVRALTKVGRVRTPVEGEILLALELTPEPKLRRLQVVAVRVQNAIDDRGQALEQVEAGAEAPFLPGGDVPGGGDSREAGRAPLRAGQRGPIGGNPGPDAGAGLAPVRLKKGAMAATSLKEISGTITARVLVEGEPGSKNVTFHVPFTLKNVALP
ncbi:MAG TPA: hypothetical protein VNX28_00085, partial [Gemmataceae bacterium]|nr:hypothetical protein [Gemmataceae bacterium]